MERNFKNVWLLAAINAIAMSSVPMMLIGSIIGAQLAPAEEWSTLPIAIMVIGTACAVVPASSPLLSGLNWHWRGDISQRSNTRVPSGWALAV